MPHKKNPIGCALTIAASLRTPGLVGAYLSAMVQEHERAAGGIQAEWPIVSELVQATGLAVASMKEVAEGLTVDAKRMKKNIEATRGLVFAERAMMMMAPALGREAARKILEKAARQVTEQSRGLGEVLADMPEVAGYLDRKMLGRLEAAEDYLGAAEEFRKRLLNGEFEGRSGVKTKRGTRKSRS